MATDNETVVDPDNGSGTDYISMDAWEDAWGSVADSGDCVGQDERAVGILRCTGGSEDDASVVVFAGWTATDATRYAMVIARQSEGYRHAGVWPSAGENIYRINKGSGNSQITLQQAYSRLYGVACNDRSLDGRGTIEVEVGGCVVESCLCKSARTGPAYGIYVHGFSSSLDTYLGNNIIVGYGGGSAGIYADAVTTSVTYCHNNTVGGCTIGFKRGVASMTISNNLVFNSTTSYSGTSFGGSHNGYDSGDAPTSNDTDLSGVDAEDIFNDADNGDYTLWAYADNPVYKKGTNLSTHEDYPITADFEDQARETWELGADELGDIEILPYSRREDLNERVCRWSLRTQIGGKLPQSGYKVRP